MRLLTTTVTSLELRQPPERVASPPASDTELSFREIRDIALDAYRTLYRSVGDPHHWTSRILPDDRLDIALEEPADAPRRAGLTGRGSWSGRMATLAAQMGR